MKDKIILFVIGILVGAVIASGAFFIYTKTNNFNNCNIENTQMNGGTPPGMPNGQPPEKPDGENSESSKHSKKSSSESSTSEETKEKSNSKTNESN